LPAAATKVQSLQRPPVQPAALSSLQPAPATVSPQPKTMTLDFFADFTEKSFVSSKSQIQPTIQGQCVCVCVCVCVRACAVEKQFYRLYTIDAPETGSQEHIYILFMILCCGILQKCELAYRSMSWA